MRKEHAVVDESLSALWVKSSLTQTHPGPKHVTGADIPLSQSKEALFLSVFQVSNPKPDTLLRRPLSAHRTHSQVSFPFMPTIAWSPPKPHRPLQAQKAAHSVCLDGPCKATRELAAGWPEWWRRNKVHRAGSKEGKLEKDSKLSTMRCKRVKDLKHTNKKKGVCVLIHQRQRRMKRLQSSLSPSWVNNCLCSL